MKNLEERMKKGDGEAECARGRQSLVIPHAGLHLIVGWERICFPTGKGHS